MGSYVPISTCQGPSLIATIIPSAIYLLLGLASNPSQHLARLLVLVTPYLHFTRAIRRDRIIYVKTHLVVVQCPNTLYGYRDEVTITGASWRSTNMASIDCQPLTRHKPWPICGNKNASRSTVGQWGCKWWGRGQCFFLPSSLQHVHFYLMLRRCGFLLKYFEPLSKLEDPWLLGRKLKVFSLSSPFGQRSKTSNYFFREIVRTLWFPYVLPRKEVIWRDIECGIRRWRAFGEGRKVVIERSSRNDVG